MNTATENSIAEMKIFHCHYISGFLTTQRVDNGLCIQRHFEVISLYMRLLNRSVHKYKCLFYQTNAYQTSVIVRCAHNKEVWLAHFVLWTLSSRAEMKNIFTAALRVPVCKPLPAAASHASVKVAFHREPHYWAFSGDYKSRSMRKSYGKWLSGFSKQQGPHESLLDHLASGQWLETLKSLKAECHLSA